MDPSWVLVASFFEIPKNGWSKKQQSLNPWDQRILEDPGKSPLKSSDLENGHLGSFQDLSGYFLWLNISRYGHLPIILYVYIHMFTLVADVAA